MFNEKEHPRDNDGKFSEKDSGKSSAYNSRNDLNILKGAKKKKMTPAEKIASVHIDFDKDNVLPELNDGDLGKIGLKQNKPVLLKRALLIETERSIRI